MNAGALPPQVKPIQLPHSTHSTSPPHPAIFVPQASFLEDYCDLIQQRHPGVKVDRTSGHQIHRVRSGLNRCIAPGAGLRMLHAWHFGVHGTGPFFEDRQVCGRVA